MNFYYDKGDKSAFSWYTMRKKSYGRKEDEQGLTLNQRLNIIYLELPKIRMLKDKRAEELTKLERWGMFLAYADNPKMRDYLRTVIEKEECIMKANDILEEISVEEANWYIQNAYDDWERDQRSREGEVRRRVDEMRKRVEKLYEAKQRKLSQLQEKVSRQQDELVRGRAEFSQQQEEFAKEQEEYARSKIEFSQQQEEFAHERETLVRQNGERVRNALAMGLTVEQTAQVFMLAPEEVLSLAENR